MRRRWSISTPLAAGAIIGIMLTVSACHTLQWAGDIPPPDEQIRMVAFEPSVYGVLPVNEYLHIQFEYDVPEAPCQIYAALQLENYQLLSEHGFVAGNSTCPVLLTGEGSLQQRVTIFYNPTRDKFGIHNTDHPQTFRATNILFAVRDHRTQHMRPIGTYPIDVTWLCEKKPFTETLYEKDVAGYRRVQELHGDFIAPVLPATGKQPAAPLLAPGYSAR